MWYNTPRAALPFTIPHACQGLSWDKKVLETTVVAHWDLANTWPTGGHQHAALIRASFKPEGPACSYFISAVALAWLRITLQSMEPCWFRAFANSALHFLLCPLSMYFCLTMCSPFSVIAHKSPLRKKMLCQDKCQLPFRDTCSKAAFMLDVPRICSGSGLWLRAAFHHSLVTLEAGLNTLTFLSRQCLERCFWFLYFLQLNGLRKLSVNLMAHKNTFWRTNVNCSSWLNTKTSCFGCCTGFICRVAQKGHLEVGVCITLQPAKQS